MSDEVKQPWWRKAAPFFSFASLAVALGVFLLGGGFVYNTWFNVPDLVYRVLPTYSIEDQSFSGIVVDNRGRKTANEVLLQTGELGCTVQRYSVDSYELWEELAGGVGESSVTLSLIHI